MFKYQVKAEGKVFEVWLNSTGPDVRSPIQYSEGVPEFREWLEGSYGLFGHSIGTATSPVDLNHALSSAEARTFEPVLLEGKELIQGYVSDIPEDSQS